MGTEKQCPFERNVLKMMVSRGISFKALSDKMIPHRKANAVAAAVAWNSPSAQTVECFETALGLKPGTLMKEAK